MTKNKFLILKILCLILIIIPLLACSSISGGAKDKETIKRIGPEETRNLVQSGQALLVCSYADGACKNILLEGALLRSELDSQVSGLPKDQKIIFY